jgi:shikimate kinase
MRLVLISGPIASGKTSVAERLAALARGRGLAAASIDMDDLVEAVGGDDWSCIGPEQRSLACEIAAAMIDRLSAKDVAVVAVAGSSVHRWEWDQVLAGVHTSPEVLTVRLRVSLAESLRRAQADPHRVSTLNVDFVSRIYAGIDWTGLPEQDLDLGTDGMSIDEVVATVASSALANS